jgi:hypothetical protein
MEKVSIYGFENIICAMGEKLLDWLEKIPDIIIIPQR